MFLFQKSNNSAKNELSSAEDVHIYVIDSSNPKKSVTVLEQKIKRRTRKDKGFWFIDVSMLKTLEEATLMLGDLSLDIDDDIFAFKFSNKSFDTTIDIWEIYKVVPENDLIVNKYGTWKRETGLFSTSLSKWHRRKNLTVSLYCAYSCRSLFKKPTKLFLNFLCRDTILRLYQIRILLFFLK